MNVNQQVYQLLLPASCGQRCYVHHHSDMPVWEPSDGQRSFVNCQVVSQHLSWVPFVNRTAFHTLDTWNSANSSTMRWLKPRSQSVGLTTSEFSSIFCRLTFLPSWISLAPRVFWMLPGRYAVVNALTNVFQTRKAIFLPARDEWWMLRFQMKWAERPIKY